VWVWVCEAPFCKSQPQTNNATTSNSNVKPSQISTKLTQKQKPKIKPKPNQQKIPDGPNGETADLRAGDLLNIRYAHIAHLVAGGAVHLV
jgi:hypothetical protein